MNFSVKNFLNNMLYIQFNYKILSESKQHETKSNHNEKILQKKKELKHIKEHNFLKQERF